MKGNPDIKDDWHKRCLRWKCTVQKIDIFPIYHITSFHRSDMCQTQLVLIIPQIQMTYFIYIAGIKLSTLNIDVSRVVVVVQLASQFPKDPSLIPSIGNFKKYLYLL